MKRKNNTPRPITPKQKEKLKMAGYKNINNWSYDQAQKQINRLYGK